jgi:hypothetical protein
MSVAASGGLQQCLTAQKAVEGIVELVDPAAAAAAAAGGERTLRPRQATDNSAGAGPTLCSTRTPQLVDRLVET